MCNLLVNPKRIRLSLVRLAICCFEADQSAAGSPEDLACKLTSF